MDDINLYFDGSQLPSDSDNDDSTAISSSSASPYASSDSESETDSGSESVVSKNKDEIEISSQGLASESMLDLEHSSEDEEDNLPDPDEDGATAFIQRIERELQASVFAVEPITHITYYLMFINELRVIEVLESHIMKLVQPNIIDRYEIARIIKAARYRNGVASCTDPDYRLEAIMIYNVDVTLKELLQYKSDLAYYKKRFTTALLSLSNFTLRPTMACFHSQNSIHIVLSKRGLDNNNNNVSKVSVNGNNPNPNPNPNPELKRYVSIRPSALTRRRR